MKLRLQRLRKSGFDLVSKFCNNVSNLDLDLNDPLRVGEYGLEQLFADNKVDLEFWGHIHLYQVFKTAFLFILFTRILTFQRSLPVLDTKFQKYDCAGRACSVYKNPKYPVHVVTGAPGNREKINTFENDTPEWSALSCWSIIFVYHFV